MISIKRVEYAKKNSISGEISDPRMILISDRTFVESADDFKHKVFSGKEALKQLQSDFCGRTENRCAILRIDEKKDTFFCCWMER